jgi:hypothetical protein
VSPLGQALLGDSQSGPIPLASMSPIGQPPNPLYPDVTPEAMAWHAQNLRDTWTAMKDPQTWKDAASAYAQGLSESPLSIRAFHGSPYDFSAFDMSKIGTGEGNQAYSRGLYFAGNEGVARTYPPGGGHMYEVNLNVEPQQLLDWDKPRDQLAPSVQKFAQDQFPNAWDKAADGSSLYQHIVRQIQSEYPGATKGYNPPPGFDAPTIATEQMTQAGIPGVQYLDQGSRGIGGRSLGIQEMPGGFVGRYLPSGQTSGAAITSPGFKSEAEAQSWLDQQTTGNPTHNYVMFDPALIDIVRKYGLAGAILGPPAAAGALSTPGAPQQQ